MKPFILRTVQILLVCALLGSLYGVFAGISSISSNAYVEHGLTHVGAKGLRASVLKFTGFGFLVGLGFIAIGMIAYPVARLLRGNWQRAMGGAIAAPFVLAALAVVGYQVNQKFLPGIREPGSIAGNIGMIGVALLLWYLLARLADTVIAAPATSKSLRRLASAAIPIVAVCLIAAQAGLWLFPPSPVADTRPNIVMVMIDTLRFDRLGAYGYARDTSPNIDALAADGKVYLQAASHAPWTKPSVASLLTSMYPRQHGIGSADWSQARGDGGVSVDTLSYQADTLAELLSNAGYATVGIGENHHLHQTGFEQGFDYYKLELEADENWTRAPEMNQRFFKWLGKHENEPFFAYLHYIDVHWPYRSPPEYTGIYAGPPLEADFNKHGFIPEHNDDPPPTFDAELLKRMSDTYDEGIRFIDDQIGALLQELKDRDLYDNSMIVLVSDHGEEFREHGMLGHGTSLYEELIRVPLIIKFPCPGKDCNHEEVDEQIELIDVMPTVLNKAGVSMPTGLFGRDATSAREQPDEGAFTERGNMIALRTPSYKFKYVLDAEREELYGLIDDPLEQSNRIDEEKELAAEFRARIFDWVEAVDTGLSVQSGKTVLDDEAIKKLEALGYVE